MNTWTLPIERNDVRRHAVPIAAAAAAALAVVGCEVEVETGEDAEETIEEHLED